MITAVLVVASEATARAASPATKQTGSSHAVKRPSLDAASLIMILPAFYLR